jgi:predicted metal-dependent hydrolase
MPSKPAPPSLDDAIEVFNRGDYFAAAEMFEDAAAQLDGEYGEVAGALNRIAAALHLRFEREARQGTINLLSQAMLAMEDMKPERAGIDIARLYDEVSAFTEEIRAAPRGEHGGVKHRARRFLERRRAPRISRRR